MIHSYWILGHRVLNFPESSNPTLVSHASYLDFNPIYSAAITVACRATAHVSHIALRGGRFALDVDLLGGA
eukprot:4713707-Pleurochrysis_carterae.AAC.2